MQWCVCLSVCSFVYKNIYDQFLVTRREYLCGSFNVCPVQWDFFASWFRNTSVPCQCCWVCSGQFLFLLELTPPINFMSPSPVGITIASFSASRVLLKTSSPVTQLVSIACGSRGPCDRKETTTSIEVLIEPVLNIYPIIPSDAIQLRLAFMPWPQKCLLYLDEVGSVCTS